MKIITVSREFGSGGREIGKRLSQELGFAYYDSEILNKIASETNFDKNYLDRISEKGITNYNFHFGTTLSFAYNQTAVNALVAQQKAIKELAKKGDCVFVGRGANVILSEYDPFKIFVYSDIEHKIARCRQRSAEEISDKELIKKFKQIDGERAKLHDLLSNAKWNDCRNYNLCINTAGVEIKEIIPALTEYIKKRFENRPQ